MGIENLKVTSKVDLHNGVPFLFVNDKPVEECCYITYYTHLNCYKDFADAGYRLFSFPVFFGDQPVNERSGIPAFKKGILYDRDDNFEEFDKDVRLILAECPDAMIFPRVNVSVCRAWEDAHPDELCDTTLSGNYRSCFSSEEWLCEVKRLLKLLIEHVLDSDYCNNIIGYQISGGNTEEWFSFDFKGSVGKASRKRYAKYLEQNNLKDSTEQYYRYLSEVTADVVCTLAKYTKELTNHKLAVGSFYGYTLECVDRTSCHHALMRLLKGDEIDFICSPVSYVDNRPVGQDHANMLPVDSLKLHRKLYFVENDTRTHVSTPPFDTPYYNGKIWLGHDKEKTLEIIKQHFARALNHGHAFWWFDMWGGWFKDKDYMALMKRVNEICKDALNSDLVSVSKVAVFVDETGFCTESETKKSVLSCYNVRKHLGFTNVPYDIYLAEDFEAVKDKYQAYIFLCPVMTEFLTDAIAYAKNNGVPYYTVEGDREMTPEDFIGFYKHNSVELLCDKKAVIYACHDYFFIHTTEQGEHNFTFDTKGFTEVFDGRSLENKMVLEKNKSYLFKKN